MTFFPQLKNFDDAEYRLLCQHLGHSLAVHERWYRMRENTAELTKIAKMLMENMNIQSK